MYLSKEHLRSIIETTFLKAMICVKDVKLLRPHLGCRKEGSNMLWKNSSQPFIKQMVYYGL